MSAVLALLFLALAGALVVPAGLFVRWLELQAERSGRKKAE